MENLITIDLTFNLPHLNKKFHIATDQKRIGIMGPSGFGKSSIARAMTGIEKRCWGKFSVRGKSLLGLPSWERKIGYVPQDYLLMPHLSVIENIVFPPGAEPQPELFQVLDLDPILHRQPRLLSGGEKQRVAIARSLCHKAQVVVMDEPFSALDKASRDRIITFLDRHCLKQDIILIIFSHDERDLAALGCEIHQLDG